MGTGAVIWVVISVGFLVIVAMTFIQRRRRRRY
jgi:hypothetical protein